ncbi:MAG TPA: response regulator [Clostridia bacterium]|nr:response regulator [Clostridia bacterium]
MDTPLRILVAEDELGDVLLLQRAFTKARVAKPIYFARDGQEVMDYLQGRPPFENPVVFPLPNLLLLDLKLPRVSGFEVLEWLRHYPGLRRMIVVVFSASNQPEDVARAYSLGANSYVVKPQDPSELVRVVERLQKHWQNITTEPDQSLASSTLVVS